VVLQLVPDDTDHLWLGNAARIISRDEGPKLRARRAFDHGAGPISPIA